MAPAASALAASGFLAALSSAFGASTAGSAFSTFFSADLASSGLTAAASADLASLAAATESFASFLGSFLGAKIESIKNPVHIAFGTVIGFMFGSVLKFVLSMYILLLIFIK